MGPQTPETVIDVVRLAAEHRPGKPAFVNLRDGRFEDKQATYGQLDESCRRIAAALQQRGAGGERILLLFPQGLDFVYGFLASIYAGAVAVPAHTPKPG